MECWTKLIVGGSPEIQEWLVAFFWKRFSIGLQVAR
jgi:hypothetical protein